VDESDISESLVGDQVKQGTTGCNGSLLNVMVPIKFSNLSSAAFVSASE
jgi:hypothetical protein